ncbi:hypothetical protein TKK_0018622 [Trichogramma kaykai]
MSCYLLDVLGFRDNGDKLIVKEMALMPLRCDAEPQTWIFKPPFQKNLLDADARHLNENTSYIHGMSWESGEIDYECINAILCEHLKDAKTIYVIDFAVAHWLRSYGYTQFFNLSTVPDYVNHVIPMIERETKCPHHSDSFMIDCAVKNVKQMLVNIMLYGQKELQQPH